MVNSPVEGKSPSRSFQTSVFPTFDPFVVLKRSLANVRRPGPNSGSDPALWLALAYSFKLTGSRRRHPSILIVNLLPQSSRHSNIRLSRGWPSISKGFDELTNAVSASLASSQTYVVPTTKQGSRSAPHSSIFMVNLPSEPEPSSSLAYPEGSDVLEESNPVLARVNLARLTIGHRSESLAALCDGERLAYLAENESLDPRKRKVVLYSHRKWALVLTFGSTQALVQEEGVVERVLVVLTKNVLLNCCPRGHPPLQALSAPSLTHPIPQTLACSSTSSYTAQNQFIRRSTQKQGLKQYTPGTAPYLGPRSYDAVAPSILPSHTIPQTPSLAPHSSLLAPLLRTPSLLDDRSRSRTPTQIRRPPPPRRVSRPRGVDVRLASGV
ncbi:hypothetical protein NMY22_g3663 [Coprinellus aureogranulatus]|nr:hypothetical protein NMY22_g3663 [Coprinellus aureogranulatus]